MRPSAFQVLWPWRTTVIRVGAVTIGKGRGGRSCLSSNPVNVSEPFHSDHDDAVASESWTAARGTEDLEANLRCTDWEGAHPTPRWSLCRGLADIKHSIDM